jgi:hypothetical protein
MASRTFICGAPETGKSTLARNLAKGYPRNVILDCSGDYLRRGFHVELTLTGLNKFIAQNYRRGFEVVYMPKRGHEALGLHHVSDMLLDYQMRPGFGTRCPLLVTVDEMSFFWSNAHAENSSLGGFKQVQNVGRHFGISVIGITQIPTSVALQFRTMCERKCIFSLHEFEARKALLRGIGPQYADALTSLRQYEFLDAISGGGVLQITKRKLPPAAVR